MEFDRIVEQRAQCISIVRCDGGKLMPDPISPIDDENILGDYCKKCSRLDWYIVRVVENKKTGLVYINRGHYVGKTIGDVLKALGFKDVENMLVCNEYDEPPLGNIQAATPEYVISPKDIAVAFQHG